MRGDAPDSITFSAAGGRLLERQRELAALEELIEEAAAGRARLVSVEGPAGIGKTRLLTEARRRATEAGMRVLSARGGQLEREFAFGVVRQLFEWVLEDDTVRDRVLAGAANQARAIFDPREHAGAETSGDTPFAALHGLYWLTANLSEDMPLLLAVDDVHWCDSNSLRFLAYLARRLEGLAVLLVCSQRPAEPGANRALLRELTAEPLSVLLHPGPLSEPAVAGVVRERLGEEAEDAFIAACHSSTQGNPLLLHELLKAMEAARVPPDADHVERVRQVGPRAVSRSVLLRLGRLGDETMAVARAAAVLEDRAEPSALAALAGVDEQHGAAAIAALVRDEVLRSEPPLGFVHPLVRSAIYGDIPPGERELYHARAAGLLKEVGAPAEQVAAHLLASPPRGENWVVETLRGAASAARANGAAESAVSYLARALREPPPGAEQPAVLVELGLAETLTSGPAATEHLRSAYNAIAEPPARGMVAELLSEALLLTGSPEEAAEVAREARAGLPCEMEDVRRALEALELVSAVLFGAGSADALRRLKRDRARAPREGVGAKMLAAAEALEWAYSGGSADTCAEIAREALAGGELIAADKGLLTVIATDVLVLADRDEALQALEASFEDARRRGSMFTVSCGHVWHGFCLYRRGELGEAEEHLLTARGDMELWGADPGLHTYIHAFLGAILLERGDLDGARYTLQSSGPPSRIFDGVRYWLNSQLALLLADGRAEEAVELAEQIAREYPRVTNPAPGHWRSLKAQALNRLGQHEEALALAQEELELARRWGASGTVGRSLRELGALEREHGLDHLREAVSVLEGSPARLEHAKALGALGTALRHARRPAEAREPLREALDLADRCGATALAEHAREELLASGARPRRFRRWGLDALTASELRVARLAAQGKRNREIAQALFVTPKTVEAHLSRCYRKLGVSGREGLAAALTADDIETVSAAKT